MLCSAIRQECSGSLKDGSIDAEWGYAKLYGAEGMLVGLRSVQSTRCKPLDEHLLLDDRHFVAAFAEPGKPDLDGITVELAPGLQENRFG